MSLSLAGCSIRATTTAQAMRASRSLKPQSRRMSRSRRSSSAFRQILSPPTERESSWSRLSRSTSAIRGVGAPRFSRPRSRSLPAMDLAAAASSGFVSSMLSRPTSFISIRSQSSRQFSLGTENLVPRLNSAICRTLSPNRFDSTSRKMWAGFPALAWVFVMGCSSAVQILDLVAAEAKNIPSDTSIWSKSANLG